MLSELSLLEFFLGIYSICLMFISLFFLYIVSYYEDPSSLFLFRPANFREENIPSALETNQSQAPSNLQRAEKHHKSPFLQALMPGLVKWSAKRARTLPCKDQLEEKKLIAPIQDPHPSNSQYPFTASNRGG